MAENKNDEGQEPIRVEAPSVEVLEEWGVDLEVGDVLRGEAA